MKAALSRIIQSEPSTAIGDGLIAASVVIVIVTVIQGLGAKMITIFNSVSSFLG